MGERMCECVRERVFVCFGERVGAHGCACACYFVRESGCVYVFVRERDRECVCLFGRERECVCLFERYRESVCNVCLRESEFCAFECVRKGVVFFNDDFLSCHFFLTFLPHSSIRSIPGFISKPFCCLFGNFFSSFSIERECLERSLTMTSKAFQGRAGFSIQGSFSPEILITCQQMPLRLTFAFYCFRKKRAIRRLYRK